ncbi:hypothetical protein G7077_02825 [Sphingomonas piscis]|uniref:Uncharacterized protein n=1 Tax=Sphingomonas piscis TaxID=2714943 RepID=A0A6G7YMN5_9SPHN|nr:hypothetical protein [Sphingomonas piscis]QIK78004.1 hypothetical protein G7077_02825 [Sphingomonas piscis]
MRDNQRGDRFIAPGTPVRYDGLEEGGSQYGIVIHCWSDDDLGAHDCYVAFFGAEMPAFKPAETPYVLRYAASSLSVLND